MRDAWRRWLLSGGAASLALSTGVASAHGFRHHQDHVLGTSFDFVVSTDDADVAGRALGAALAEIARLDPILSNWREDSELAALNAAAEFSASPDLFAVVERAERARELTGGAYSPRLGVLSAAWRDAKTRNEIPAAQELAAIARDAAEAGVSLEAERRLIRRPDAVRFDLDGAAKGYVIDRALHAAREAAPEASGLMVDVGGDIATWGRDPAGDAWRVGVAAPNAPDNAPPATMLELRGHAIAFSGAGARDVVIGDQAFPHLLSSQGGWASRENRSAAVIAATAEEADILATALAVMPAEDGLDLIARTSGAAAQIIAADGRTLESEEWSSFVSQTCQAPAAWPEAFAVSISYEVPRVTGSTKPYISMWISDQQGNVVRTLLVFGNDAEWREMNYIFWRRIERANPAGVQAMARPSRAPGRYDVVWDGLDNAGRPVAQGAYNLNVEVNREHGSHNFQAIPLNLSAAPSQAESTARSEIGAISVRYGRRS